VKIQVTVDPNQFPVSVATATASSWADVARDALRLYEWAAAEIMRGGRLRLADQQGEETTVVLPGIGLAAHAAGGLTEPSPQPLPSRAGIIEEVEREIAKAKEAMRQPGSASPPIPTRLASADEAKAALHAAVWWAGRPGIPAIPLGQKRVQHARLNTAPIAVLSSILITPGASKAELEATLAFLMPEIGGKIPTTDSVGFWTSPRMQDKHGYIIKREGDQHRYDEVDDELPE